MNEILGHEDCHVRIEKLDHHQKQTARQIYSVFQRSYRIEAQLLGVSLFPPLQDKIQDIQHSNSDYYGYWEGRSLAAVAELEVSRFSVTICSFVVDPDYFRRGIGSSLLDAVLSYFPDRDKVVETGLDNQPAIALYHKKGFREINRRLTEVGIAKTRLCLPAITAAK